MNLRFNPSGRMAAALLALTLMAPAASASSPVLDSGDNHPHFGMRLGLDVELPDNWWVGDIGVEMFTPGCGVAVGGYFNVPVVANMYFEPGLTLFYNTAGSDITTMSDDFGSAVQFFSKRSFGMRVPLQLGYRFTFTDRFALAVYTGPEMAVRFTERLHAKNTTPLIEENFDESMSDELKRFGLGWKIGGAVEVDRWSVSLSGTIGMLNRVRDAAPGVSFRENLFNVSLGYSF